MTSPRAQLRVFSPLEAFPSPERERWRGYLDADGGMSRRQAAAAEERVSRRVLLTGRLCGDDGGAMVRRAGRRLLLCPLQLQLRSAVALDSLRTAVPAAVADAFLADEGDLDRVAALAGSGRMPHVLDAAWAPPLVWFAAFSPPERRFTDPPEGAGPRLVYLTIVSQAVERLERVHDVVDGALEDADELLSEIGELTVWLDAFDPSSLLELDYGDLAARLTADDLRDDHTCAEVWRAVEALAAGDPLDAAEAYGTARSRWERRQATPFTS